jgi:hypothetical protein
VDGVVGTCLSQGDYEAKLVSDGYARSLGVAEAGVSMMAEEELGLKLSSSEESTYRGARDQAAVTPIQTVNLKTDDDVGPTLPKRKYGPKGSLMNVKLMGVGLQARAQAGVREPKVSQRQGPFPGLKKVESIGRAIHLDEAEDTKPPAKPKAAKVTVKTEVSKTSLKPEAPQMSDKTQPAMEQAMLFTMQQLANTLTDMQVEMYSLRNTVGGLQDRPLEARAGNVQANRAVPTIMPDTPRMREIEPTDGPFYAVAKGAGGHQGIYRLWSKASPWVNGVPGNVHQKCHCLDRAQEFIDNFDVEQSRRTQGGGGGNLM